MSQVKNSSPNVFSISKAFRTKSRKAFWSLAVWVTASVLVVAPPNVEGVTTCYDCSYIRSSSRGRSNSGQSHLKAIQAKFVGIQGQGRKTAPDDPSCSTLTPHRDVVCQNGCLWSVFSSEEGTLYYRSCAHPHPDGCVTLPDSDAKVCYCSTERCNDRSEGGGRVVNGSNRCSPSSGLYTTVVAIGALVHLILVNVTFLKASAVNE